MCIPGGRPWPLAVTREVIGWTKVDEIQPQNGEYTLYEASAAYKEEKKRQERTVLTGLPQERGRRTRNRRMSQERKEMTT